MWRGLWTCCAGHNERHELANPGSGLKRADSPGRTMTTRGRILKSHEDITMTELTFSGGNAVVSKLSVRAASDPTSTKQFSDMDAANTYYEELISRRQRGASV